MKARFPILLGIKNKGNIGPRLSSENSSQNLFLFSEPTGSKLSQFKDVSFLMKGKNGSSWIGEALKRLREERGLIQRDLARRARVGRATVQRAEKGDMNALSVDCLGKIMEALEIDWRELAEKSVDDSEGYTIRGDTSRIEFSLDFSEEGFQLISYLPLNREMFYGRIKIRADKTVVSKSLPHPDEVYLHAVVGKIVLVRGGKEYFIKPGEDILFSGRQEYELYNPDPIRELTCLYVTHPSFILF